MAVTLTDLNHAATTTYTVIATVTDGRPGAVMLQPLPIRVQNVAYLQPAFTPSIINTTPLA